MRFLARIALLALLLVGTSCAPDPKPDYSLILWEQPSPETAARLHAQEIKGLASLVIGSSMEPFLFTGDWVVIELFSGLDKLKGGDVVLYYHAQHGLILHRVTKKYSDGWALDGINNPGYDGVRLNEGNYWGKMIRGYTKRVKP